MFSIIQRCTTLAVIIMLFLLASCAGAPATASLNDLPMYPGAVELKPGESTLADTLANNNQADTAIRGNLGTGGKTEQRGFHLPADSSWNAIKAFYDEKLKADGWATNSMVSGIMEQANQGNDIFQSANWQRGKQNVTVIMLTAPIDKSQKELIISLSSQ